MTDTEPSSPAFMALIGLLERQNTVIEKMAVQLDLMATRIIDLEGGITRPESSTKWEGVV